jgi:hypothetical protein
MSGCGGSSGAVQTSSSTTSLVARADAICRRLNAELVANLPKSVSPQAVASVTPRNAALEQRAVSELARLQPPQSSAQKWREIISYRGMLATALTDLARAAKAGNRASMARLSQYKQRVRRKLLVTGERGGFSSCQKLG